MRLGGDSLTIRGMIRVAVTLQVFAGSPHTIANCLLFMRPVQVLNRRVLTGDAEECKSKPVLKCEVELVCGPKIA